LSSFLVEAERRAQTPAEATDEDWKIASTSSGLEAIVFSSILMSGEIKDPNFVTWMEKDSTFMRIASISVGLAQSISYVMDAIVIQGEDSPFTAMKQQITKELNLQQGQLSTVPSIVERVMFSFTKVANFYYDSCYEQESLSELQRLFVSRVE
jgi:hypothetical protein